MSDTTQAEEAAMYRWLRSRVGADSRRGKFAFHDYPMDFGSGLPMLPMGWRKGSIAEHFDAAIRQAMEDDAALTDRIGAALAAPGCERLRDYYATGPVQRASVETFVAALGVASLQSVASAETCRDAAGVAPAALADANHQCNCSRHPPGSYCDAACTYGVKGDGNG